MLLYIFTFPVTCVNFLDQYRWQFQSCEHFIHCWISDDDLTTINADALRTLQDVGDSISHIIPHVAPQQSVPGVPDTDDSCGPVTEELIQSCVTPRKVLKVRETLRGEKVWHRCAVKLLPHFFTKEELAMCNTEGNFEKAPLDWTRLHSLKGKFYDWRCYCYQMRLGTAKLKKTQHAFILAWI